MALARGRELGLTGGVEIANQTQQRPGYVPQPERLINVELDVEKRLMALVLKDRVRIKQFFLDFDRLRKGTVGVAAVSVTS